ncbi:MAG TPA: hypothetical protein VK728_04895 [Candidatus Sulfotelmatobacter sp.]|nr:hypothetical protein [Candidatus Sulfotelmatobacter sp.]
MRNWRHQVTFASCMFILGSLGIPAMAQEQASLQPASLRTKDEAAPAPKPKPKKVWTEDSIAEVRTPADNYQDSKAAQSSAQATPVDAAAASNQGVPKGLGAPPIVLTIPKTAEETQKAIDQRKDMSENFHNLLSNAQERLETETNPMVRATLQEKANLLLGDISSTNSEIKTLEKALEDYKNGKAPAQPKTDGPASAPDSAKPAVQSAASNTPQ